KKIVEVLDEAQKLIDNRKKQIKLLDDLIESIFYDMFGDPVKNDKGWEVKKFDDFSNVRSSKRVYISECVDKGIPFYRGTEIVKLSLGEEVFPELFITEDHYKALKKETGIPKIGDLLLPSICAKGEVWRVDTNNPFYFKDGRVLWVELESDFIDSKYLQYCLSQVLIKNFEGIASGSTFPEMKIFILKNLEIPIPPLPLQNQFAEKVQAIEKQKELLEESLKLMEDNYNSLMQRAFKGELF
ncbi:restriction endonuclease subunit S, partial [Anaerosalibacter bizertensis]|nr:restriction endonuclease subunit S [Anaerosalibacter bizertensis]